MMREEVDLKRIIRERFGEKCVDALKDHLEVLRIRPMEEDKEAELIKLGKIFSNRIRVKIIHLLSQASLPVCLLATLIGEDQTLISHNLNYLRKMGIVKMRKVGKFRIYSLNKEKVMKILRVLNGLL